MCFLLKVWEYCSQPCSRKPCVPHICRQQNAGDATASCTPAHTPHERDYGNMKLENMGGHPIFNRFTAGVPANHPSDSRNGPPRNRADPVPGKIPAPLHGLSTYAAAVGSACQYRFIWLIRLPCALYAAPSGLINARAYALHVIPLTWFQH